MNELTIYVAKATMTLKDKNSCLSCIQTVWRDEPILVVYNNLANTIIDTLFSSTIQSGDIKILEKLVSNFLKEDS